MEAAEAQVTFGKEPDRFPQMLLAAKILACMRSQKGNVANSFGNGLEYETTLELNMTILKNS